MKHRLRKSDVIKGNMIVRTKIYYSEMAVRIAAASLVRRGWSVRRQLISFNKKREYYEYPLIAKKRF